MLKKLVTMVMILFLTVILLSGCGGSSDSDNLNTAKSIDVLVTDVNNSGIPKVPIVLSDDNQSYSKTTDSSGTASFDSLSLSDNKIYQVTAKDYINKSKNFDFSSGDKTISPIEINFDSVLLTSYDDFSDSNSGWENTKNDVFRSEYVNEKYEIELKNHPNGKGAQNPGILNEITDFVLSADIELLSGVGNYGFEIAWNNYNNYVYVGIVNKNDLKIIWVRENDNSILEKDISSYFNEKNINNLKFVQEELNTTIYLNGELIETIKLSQVIPEEATLTLNVNTEDADALPTVSFDNFRLLQLN